MLTFNTGVLAKRGNEGGRTGITVAKPSPVTDARISAMKQIQDMALSSGMSINKAVTNILSDPKSQEELIYYVRSKYESTMRDPVKLAVQAMLLRFRDVATIAKALNITDAEAMIEVENAEYQAMQTNVADAGVLSIPIQACLVIAMDEFISASSKQGVASDSAAMYNKIISIVGDNYDASLTPILQMSAGADNADGGINLGDFRPDAGSVDTSGVYSSGGGSSDSGGGFLDSLNDIFSTINSAIGVVKNATGAISGAANTTTGAINQVGGALDNAVSGIGGSSINKSSLPWIIGGGILLIIVVIVVIYATNRK